MAYVIVEPCIGVKDSACVEVCAPDAIHEGEDQFYIDAYECMSCGVCEPECPVEAIYEERCGKMAPSKKAADFSWTTRWMFQTRSLNG